MLVSDSSKSVEEQIDQMLSSGGTPHEKGDYFYHSHTLDSESGKILDRFTFGLHDLSLDGLRGINCLFDNLSGFIKDSGIMRIIFFLDQNNLIWMQVDCEKKKSISARGMAMDMRFNMFYHDSIFSPISFDKNGVMDFGTGYFYFDLGFERVIANRIKASFDRKIFMLSISWPDRFIECEDESRGATVEPPQSWKGAAPSLKSKFCWLHRGRPSMLIAVEKSCKWDHPNQDLAPLKLIGTITPSSMLRNRRISSTLELASRSFNRIHDGDLIKTLPVKYNSILDMRRLGKVYRDLQRCDWDESGNYVLISNCKKPYPFGPSTMEELLGYYNRSVHSEFRMERMLEELP